MFKIIPAKNRNEDENKKKVVKKSIYDKLTSLVSRAGNPTANSQGGAIQIQFISGNNMSFNTSTLANTNLSNSTQFLNKLNYIKDFALTRTIVETYKDYLSNIYNEDFKIVLINLDDNNLEPKSVVEGNDVTVSEQDTDNTKKDDKPTTSKKVNKVKKDNTSAKAKEIIDFVEDYVNQIDLKSLVTGSLEDLLIYGSFCSYIYKDEKDEDRTYYKSLGIEKNSYSNFLVATDVIDSKMEVVYSDEFSSNMDISEENQIGLSDIFIIQLNPVLVAQKFFNSDVLLDRDIPKWKEKIAFIDFYSGSSLLESIVDQLVSIKLHDRLTDKLSLRQLTQKKLKTLQLDNVADINDHEIIESLNSLENYMNEDVEGGISFDVDPAMLEQSILQSLNVTNKIIPKLSAVDSINDIDNSTDEDRISKFLDRVEQMRTQTLANVAIPQELYEGTASRFEVLSRADKFNDAINAKVVNINYHLQLHIQGVVFNKFQILLPLSCIKIELNGTYNESFNNVSNKLDNLNDMFDKLSQISQKFDDFGKSAVFDPEGTFEYMKSELKKIVTTDEYDIFKDKYEPPPADDDGGNGGRNW